MIGQKVSVSLQFLFDLGSGKTQINLLYSQGKRLEGFVNFFILTLSFCIFLTRYCVSLELKYLPQYF